MKDLEDTSIQSVVNRLKERGTTHPNGMMGNDVVIEKSTLNLAAAYLEDYLLLIENLEVR